MKQSKRILALLMGLALLVAALCGCGKKDAETKPDTSAAPAEAAETPEASSAPARADGERFEATIMIEGMEETIQLEHVRNETAGFEIDYDYENFTRVSAPDRERFVWGYDDPNAPENYIEVSYCAEDAETVANAVSETLSKEYDLYRDDAFDLDGAGKCIRFNASAAADGSGTTEVLQDVYIIPADDGCRVARVRYIAEGSDGFGIRLNWLVNTMTVMEAKGERTLSDDEALDAVKRYCLIQNPALADKVDNDAYTVGWAVEQSSEDEVVVLFRSYTSAEVRYYVDPVSGDATVTEFMPGITPEEQPTDETVNLWDYLNWWVI